MKRKNQIITASLILIALMSVIYTFISNKSNGKITDIYVWKQDIGAGNSVSEDMFQKISLEDKNISESLGVIVGDIVGRTIIREIKKGDIVSENDFYNDDTHTVYPILEPGNQLYTIAVKASEANGWWLYPDRTINIYLTLFSNLNSGDGTPSEDSLLDKTLNFVQVIEDVKIIKIMNDDGNAYTGNEGSHKLLCVELSTEKIKILLQAEKHGTIRVSANP